MNIAIVLYHIVIHRTRSDSRKSPLGLYKLLRNNGFGMHVVVDASIDPDVGGAFTALNNVNITDIKTYALYIILWVNNTEVPWLMLYSRRSLTNLRQPYLLEM